MWASKRVCAPHIEGHTPGAVAVQLARMLPCWLNHLAATTTTRNMAAAKPQTIPKIVVSEPEFWVNYRHSGSNIDGDICKTLCRFEVVRWFEEQLVWAMDITNPARIWTVEDFITSNISGPLAGWPEVMWIIKKRRSKSPSDFFRKWLTPSSFQPIGFVPYVIKYRSASGYKQVAEMGRI